MKPEEILEEAQKEERPKYHERYIGLNVHYVRKILLHMSQEEFAFGAGMSKDTISNIERGVYLPSVHNLINISNYVNMPVDFFLRDNMDNMM